MRRVLVFFAGNLGHLGFWSASHEVVQGILRLHNL